MNEEISFIDYAVTCETVGCGNGMIAIPVQAPEVNPYFICGACNEQITNYTTIDNGVF